MTLCEVNKDGHSVFEGLGVHEYLNPEKVPGDPSSGLTAGLFGLSVLLLFPDV